MNARDRERRARERREKRKNNKAKKEENANRLANVKQQSRFRPNSTYPAIPSSPSKLGARPGLPWALSACGAWLLPSCIFSLQALKLTLSLDSTSAKPQLPLFLALCRPRGSAGGERVREKRWVPTCTACKENTKRREAREKAVLSRQRRERNERKSVFER